MRVFVCAHVTGGLHLFLKFDKSKRGFSKYFQKPVDLIFWTVNYKNKNNDKIKARVDYLRFDYHVLSKWLSNSSMTLGKIGSRRAFISLDTDSALRLLSGQKYSAQYFNALLNYNRCNFWNFFVQPLGRQTSSSAFTVYSSHRPFSLIL